MESETHGKGNPLARIWGTFGAMRSLFSIVLCLLSGCSDNFAPVFDPQPIDRVLTVGETARFEVHAIDRDGGKIKYGARGLPVGSTFDRDQSPPIFRWSPVASDAASGGRPHPVTFIAQDEDGARTEARVLFTVFLGDTAPRFTSPNTFVLDLRQDPTLDVWVVIRDDDSTEVSFALIDAPDGAELDAEKKQARLTWTPSPDQIEQRRVFGFTISVWDDDSADAVQQQLTVVVDEIEDP